MHYLAFFRASALSLPFSIHKALHADDGLAEQLLVLVSEVGCSVCCAQKKQFTGYAPIKIRAVAAFCSASLLL